MRGRGVSVLLILALVVGAFLILDGIAGLITNDSIVGQVGRALGTQASAIRIIVAIIELAAGALLIVSRFIDVGRLSGFLSLVLLIAWAVVIALVLFVRNLAPDELGWWIALLQDLIVLAAIWVVTREE